MASTGTEEKGKLFSKLEQSCWSYARHGIPSLFNLQSAATVLRSVRAYLNPEHCRLVEQDLEKFYDDIEEIESFASTIGETKYKPIVIVVEERISCGFPFIIYCFQGIDGSGKSTQTRMLASRLCSSKGGGARATPPPSLGSVRECFDRCGGVAARAFYVFGILT